MSRVGHLLIILPITFSHYRYDDIFPLRDSSFEGFPVKVPFAYTELLVEEYGLKVLTNVRFPLAECRLRQLLIEHKLNFRNHRYDLKKQDWVPQG